jgi:hypothetical protein
MTLFINPCLMRGNLAFARQNTMYNVSHLPARQAAMAKSEVQGFQYPETPLYCFPFGKKRYA